MASLEVRRSFETVTVRRPPRRRQERPKGSDTMLSERAPLKGTDGERKKARPNSPKGRQSWSKPRSEDDNSGAVVSRSGGREDGRSDNGDNGGDDDDDGGNGDDVVKKVER